MRTYLDFEKPIAELESKVAELKALAGEQASVAIADELVRLEGKAKETLQETYAELTPWQKTQVARHPERPHFKHYIKGLVRDFTPLSGDRYFGEDEAIIGGIGRLSGRSVMVIGHEKGSDTEGRIKHNFGMARPEGYRKAVRLMEMADRFSLPVITLIDTANRIYMLEHSIYTVASPEAAASILWRDSTRAVDAATNMKITAQDLLRLRIVDGIIPEPVGGAHRDAVGVVKAAGDVLVQALSEYDDLAPDAIRKQRREKFLAMGRAV